jgi:uncharacterized protein (DUF2252 family)
VRKLKRSREAPESLARILLFNRGRDPERLRLKYKAMAKDALAFFRGTAHLFWEDWPRHSALDRAPLAWNCGDLHLENFGAYRGENRLEYFDLDDFDEAALAPCTRDPIRCVCSLLLADRDGDDTPQAPALLGGAFLEAYADAMTRGKPAWIERDTASGEIRRLLRQLMQRTRLNWLESRTRFRSGARSIRIDRRRALRARPVEWRRAARIVRSSASRDERRFFRVIDVARRIAGTGSLGLERYVVLVQGKRDPDRNVLVDVKRAVGSSLASHVEVSQPRWKSEAERVVWTQSHMQAVSPALLRAVVMGTRSYVLKELQPRQDRLTWKRVRATTETLEDTVRCMGRLAAWAQLRAAGRRGAAGVEDLMNFAAGSSWRSAALRYAAACARHVRRDHAIFRRAWKKRSTLFRQALQSNGESPWQGAEALTATARSRPVHPVSPNRARA